MTAILDTPPTDTPDLALPACAGELICPLTGGEYCPNDPKKQATCPAC